MSQIFYRTTDTAAGGVLTLTGFNSGGPVSPDGSGNITFNIAGGISIDGNPGTNSLRFTITGGGLGWVPVTSATQSMAANTGYFANFAGPAALEFTLPETCPRNRVIRVAGMGPALWTIKQNADQKIHFDNIPQTLADNVTTTGIAGSLSATATNKCVELICIVANLEFMVLSHIGNLNVV